MIELVGHQQRLLIRYRANHAHVRHIAGREDQRPFAPGERGELGFERLVFDAVARYQVRGSAADTEARGGRRERAHHLGVTAEPEVVVTAEVDQVVTRHHAPRAFEIALLEVGERGLQRCRVALHAAPGRAGAWECEQSGPWTCGSDPAGVNGSMPRRVSSARSRATSGLPVVSSFSPKKMELAPARKQSACNSSLIASRPAE